MEDLVEDKILGCSNFHSNVKYCGYNIKLCSFACPEHSHQIGLRCYGKSINNNKIYKVYFIYIIILNTLEVGIV